MRRPAILLTAAILAFAAAGCSGGSDAVDDPGTEPGAGTGTLDPDTPVQDGNGANDACLAGATDCQDTGGDMGAPEPGDGATPVTPAPEGLRDLREISWDSVEVDPDDQTRVTVFWTSGVEPCNVLSEVRAEYADDAVTLTVVEGSTPDDVACIEIAVSKQTTVVLDEEVGPRSIRDGADQG